MQYYVFEYNKVLSWGVLMKLNIFSSKSFVQLAMALFLLLLISGLGLSSAFAANKAVNLVIGYKTVNFAGKEVKALAVNNQIPAPTLHFKEGDDVTINVHNHLDQGTSLHWHGLIIPWKMDGVPGVTQKPIPPGGVFHYHFKLKQFGTYWYHAHSGLQEQRGLYGAIIIDPKAEKIHYTKDFVIVLSDWTNSDPDQVLANLKKDGDFYSPKFPIQTSLSQYIDDYKNAKTPKAKAKIKSAYDMMQQMRMSVYDLSDVAYDGFLLNGRPTSNPWTGRVKVGDTVRLRFIGAGASTLFQVKIADTTMQMVHVQGQDAQPYPVKSFTIAPGETYDVLVKIKKNKPYIIYAAPEDKTGFAVGALITKQGQQVNYQAVKPFPKPGPIMMMGHDMSQHDMSMMKPTVKPKSTSMMQHHAHAGHHSMMPMMKHAKPKKSLSSNTKYDDLKATTKTNDPNVPVHEIKMNLSGFMDRYVWFLNGKPEYEAEPILIEHGKRYRFKFVNNTMMHHPMHLHGHWMILRNGHGAYDPLVHTIDVPPGATVVADFDANTEGQWYFHCHNLYHMKAGMANIFRYKKSIAETKGLNGNKKIGWFLANELDINGDFINNSYEGSLRVMFGSDYNKFQFNLEDADIKSGKVEQANVDLFYWRLISQFWAIKGGANYVYRPANKPYWQPGVGIEGIMPYFIQTDLRAYLHKGSVKFDLDLMRDTQLAHNLYLRIDLSSIFATRTIEGDSIGSGLNNLQWTFQPYYQINSNLTVYLQYEYIHNYGELRKILNTKGEPASEGRFSIGLDLLF